MRRIHPPLANMRLLFVFVAAVLAGKSKRVFSAQRGEVSEKVPDHGRRSGSPHAVQSLTPQY